MHVGRFFICLFLICSSPAFAQAPHLIYVKNSYSYDGLPKTWLLKRKVLKHLDDILPKTIDALAHRRSCITCKADYYITLGYDSLYIRDRRINTNPVVVWGEYDVTTFNHGNTDWQEEKLLYSVRSHLSVWAADGTERYRLILTDSDAVFQIPVTNETINLHSAVPVAIESFNVGYFPRLEVIERMILKQITIIQKRLQRAAY